MMNVTKTPVTVNEGSFVSEALESASTRVAKVAAETWTDVRVGVGVTEMVKEISEVLKVILEAKNPSIPLTASSIEELLLTLVALRCMQVSSKLPKGIMSRDIPVPDFFRPFLAYIGKYEDQFRALTIIPEWTDGVEISENAEKADGASTARLMDFDEIRRVARTLKANGVRCTDGLPQALVTPDDALFRVREDANGYLTVAGDDVGEAVLIVRAVVRVQFSQMIFGAARTRYLSVEDLRPALESIVATGFVQ